MTCRRLSRLLLVHTTVAAVCTLALALARGGINNWSRVRAITTEPVTTVYGVGPPSDDGHAWSWLRVSRRGGVWCSSFIVDNAERERILQGPRPDRYVPGRPSAWAAAGEAPTPPSIDRFQSGCYPYVVDAAYGWPEPCLAVRLESFSELPLPAQEEALIRSDPRLAALTPPGPIFEHPVELVSGLRAESFLTNLNIHDGYWPTKVLWGGFTVNVAFLVGASAVLRLLWRGGLVVRRRRRQAMNRCTACGYSLAGTASEDCCPECGGDRTPSRSRFPEPHPLPPPLALTEPASLHDASTNQARAPIPAPPFESVGAAASSV